MSNEIRDRQIGEIEDHAASPGIRFRCQDCERIKPCLPVGFRLKRERMQAVLKMLLHCPKMLNLKDGIRRLLSPYGASTGYRISRPGESQEYDPAFYAGSFPKGAASIHTFKRR